MNKEEKDIVLARLQSMPANMKLSIGDEGTFTKWQLLENVEKETDTGDFIVKVYMEGLRSFK